MALVKWTQGWPRSQELPASLEMLVIWEESDPHSCMPDSRESWAKWGTKGGTLCPSPSPPPTRGPLQGLDQKACSN